jgi:hypothetical protein
MGLNLMGRGKIGLGVAPALFGKAVPQGGLAN